MQLGKSFMIILLMPIGLLLFACAAPSSGTCDENGLCVDIELQEPIQMNEPVSVTIVVESKEDMPDLPIFLSSSDPDILVNGESEWIEWIVDIKEREPMHFSATIQFPETGWYNVNASVLHPAGRVIRDTVPVRITALGGTAYPESEMTPGVPAPVEPVTPTVSPEALLPDTPALPPSAGIPVPELYAQTTSSGIVLGNWSLIVSEGFESQFPPSGSSWVVQDLSNDGYERYWDDDDYMAYAARLESLAHATGSLEIMDTMTLLDWTIILLGGVAMYTPRFQLAKSKRLTGKELSKTHPEYGWVKWRFIILYTSWIILLAVAFFHVFINSGVQTSCVLGGLYASIGLFTGAFAIVTGVCYVPMRTLRLLFVVGDEARRAGKFQVGWSLMVIVVACVMTVLHR